jgi:hypothetical protein
MKSMLKVSVLTVLCASVINTSALASKNAVLIVPGKQLGTLRLQSYPKGLPLGNPDYSDAGMNHETMVWKSGKSKNTLLVETTNNAVIDNETGYTLHYIRVTSPVYRDSHGLRTGDTLASIRRFYSHLQPWDNKPSVLADNALGIAFEFESAHPAAGSKCIAIAVYEPGGGVWAEYDASDVRDLEKGN